MEVKKKNYDSPNQIATSSSDCRAKLGPPSAGLRGNCAQSLVLPISSSPSEKETLPPGISGP